MTDRFDTLVLGAGPAGQRAALELARHRRRVGLVEARSALGGVCLHEGTIPSKALRTAILYLSGRRVRMLAGAVAWPKKRLEGSVLVEQVERVIERELAVIERLMSRHGVDVLYGRARFLSDHAVLLDEERRLEADSFVVAVGSRARRLDGVMYDDEQVIDSDQLYSVLASLPDRVTIVGAGVVGMEYASMLALAGLQVRLVSHRPEALGFVDQDLVSVCLDAFAEEGGRFLAPVRVDSVSREGGSVSMTFADGTRLEQDLVMYAVGRQAALEGLGLDAAGIDVDQGRVVVDEAYRTSRPNIVAAGDVIGPPSLASTSREQGRLAALSLLGRKAKPLPSDSIPYGIYTIPEIAWVGATEHALAAAGRPCVVGRASYDHLAKGEMLGDRTGFLKLLFHPETRKLLGAGMVGTDATEVIHLAKALVERGAVLDDVLSDVFNYPTLAEAYKVAAMDAEVHFGEQS